MSGPEFNPADEEPIDREEWEKFMITNSKPEQKYAGRICSHKWTQEMRCVLPEGHRDTDHSPLPSAAPVVTEPEFTNRHGDRCSQACGEGRHAECTETFATCHCTYRGLHVTMHAYISVPDAVVGQLEGTREWVESLRESCHDNYNGGHHEKATNEAFHHGMDTVCSVLAGFPGKDGALQRFLDKRIQLAPPSLPKAGGFNGAFTVAIEALRYLAERPRPEGGEQRFNSEHLYQIADEIGISLAALPKAGETANVSRVSRTGDEYYCCTGPKHAWDCPNVRRGFISADRADKPPSAAPPLLPAQDSKDKE